MITIETPYTGHVSAGSAAQSREVPGARVLKMSVGPMDNNTYLVQCTETGEALLIDAANEPARIIELVGQETPDQVRLIVTTHQHPDHWQGLAEVAAALGAPTAAHALDADPLPVAPSRLLADGDTARIGALTFEAIHLVGHTPGSIALTFVDGAERRHVFTGDCLFPGGIGRTTKPAEFESLFDGVTSKLFDRYPDNTAIYPGHGDDTTLGAERPHLQEWQQRKW